MCVCVCVCTGTFVRRLDATHPHTPASLAGPSPPASDATTKRPAAPEPAAASAAAAAPAAPTAAEIAAAARAEGKERCRNYGCNQWFKEDENTDAACRHHCKPPIFHETKKGWSCCSERCVWDWEDFIKIEGCTVGRHSTVDPKVKFATSPSAAAAEGSGAGAGAAAAAAAAPVVLKTVEQFNASNPDAATAASSAAKTLLAGPPAPAPRSDGKATCVHHGCRLEYVVAENVDDACTYHKGQPVFHDGGKHWSCCPTKVKYDFDEFMKVPGCTTGPHEDGSKK